MKPTVIGLSVLTIAVVGFLIYRKYHTSVSQSGQTGTITLATGQTIPATDPNAAISVANANKTAGEYQQAQLLAQQVVQLQQSPFWASAFAQVDASPSYNGRLESLMAAGNALPADVITQIANLIASPNLINPTYISKLAANSGAGSTVDGTTTAGSGAENYIKGTEQIRGSISGPLPQGSLNLPSNANAGQKYQAAVAAGYTPDQASYLASLEVSYLNYPSFANYFLQQIANGSSIPDAVSATHALI